MIGVGDVVGEWVSQRVGGEWFKQGSFAIGEEKDGKIVAGVIYDNYNQASVRGTIAADRLSRDFLWAILDYPFNVLKVNCILATTSSENEKSQRFLRKIGFEYIATAYDAMPDGDMLIYKLIKEDCRKFMR